MNMSYYMNMITRSSNNVWMTGFIFKDSHNIREKDVLILIIKKGGIIKQSILQELSGLQAGNKET